MFRREYGDDSIRTFFISAAEKARSVCVRALPSLPVPNPIAVIQPSSGTCRLARTSYWLRVQNPFLPGLSLFFPIVLETAPPLRPFPALVGAGPAAPAGGARRERR